MIKTIAIVSLSSGILGESFVQHVRYLPVRIFPMFQLEGLFLREG